MGVFETIFKKPKADIKADGYFRMLNGYQPVFTSAPESIYEMELTRAAIHSFASFCSKLKPEISGSARRDLERVLQFIPDGDNPFGTEYGVYCPGRKRSRRSDRLLSGYAVAVRSAGSQREAVSSVHVHKRTARRNRV